MKPILPFGKYLLLERISVGGMAEVFKARPASEDSDRLIAIKRILPSMAEDADFISMFIDEARIAGQLNHPHIAQIYELSQVGESHFIAMEYVWGKDVLQIQNRFRRLKSVMPFPMAAYIGSKMAEALDYAHRKQGPDGAPLGIIHRDVSPQNVLVSYHGEIKVIDFGIAKAASRATKTQAGVLKGKFGYMSPEQVAGEQLDRRSDVFSIGTILYEMITADRLFMGESDFATLEKVRNVDVRPPIEAVPACPPEIDRIIRKALARSPSERYAWGAELAADLRAWLADQPFPFGAAELGQWMQENFAAEVKRESQALDEQQRAAGEMLRAHAAGAELGVGMMAVGGGLVQAFVPRPASTQEVNVDDILANESGLLDGGLMPLGGDATQILAPEVAAPLLSAASTMIVDAAQVGGLMQGAGELQAESTRILSPTEAAPPFPSTPAAPEAHGDEMPAQATAILDTSTMRPPPARPSHEQVTPPSVVAVHPASPRFPTPAPLPAYPSSGGPGRGQTGQLDAHPATSLVEALPYTPRPAPGSTLAKDVLVGVTVALLVIAGVMGYRIYRQRSAPRGAIVVALSPPLPARVFVDHIERGSATAGHALTLRGLPAGRHRVEILGETFSFVESVDVGDGDVGVVNEVIAVPPPIAVAAAPVAEKPPAAPEVDAAAPSPPTPAAAEATPTSVATDEKKAARAPADEVHAEGHAPLRPAEHPPAAARVAVEKPAARTPAAPAAPVAAKPTGPLGHLVVKTDPAGAEVVVGTRSAGVTPLEITDVPAAKAVRVQVRKKGFVIVSKFLDFEKEPDRVLDLKLLSVGGAASREPTAPPTEEAPPAAAAPADTGYLVANTQPWAKIAIDGHDTGKSTPISPSARLSLKAGRHSVTFSVDGKKYTFTVDVKAGETTRLIKTLVDETH